MSYLVYLIRVIANLLVVLIILDAVLSYFLSPYNPVRVFLNRLLGPMLNPIRRAVPLVGMFDLSPLILILLIQAFSWALINLLSIL